MTDSHSQQTYQVRLGWGVRGLTRLAPSGIVVVIDAIGSPERLVADALALSHSPVVFAGSLRNATATAQAVYDDIRNKRRTTKYLHMAPVLAGDVPELADSEFSVIVESTNGVEIVVERAMYWNGPGSSFWAGGTNATAVKLQ